MGFYDNHILPHILNVACSIKPVSLQRQKVVPVAEGRILEIGMGSGLNLPFYNTDKVDFVWGLEPSEGMRKRAQKRVQSTPFDVRWLDLPGEEIPLEDNCADTIVTTYTLCTIPDWLTAVRQMRRVLKPGGKLLFCEHGKAPDAAVRKWQDKLTPYWKKGFGGCHLNRDIPRLLREGGFDIEQLDSMYMPSTPKFAGFNYWGSAV